MFKVNSTHISHLALVFIVNFEHVIADYLPCILYSGFFWSLFSGMRTEYGDLLSP